MRLNTDYERHSFINPQFTTRIKSEYSVYMNTGCTKYENTMISNAEDVIYTVNTMSQTDLFKQFGIQILY